MTRRKLVMNFIKESDHLGNAKYKKVTLKVRPEATDETLRIVVDMYCELTANELVEATVVDSRDLVTGGDFYEVEEIFYNAEQEKPTITVDEGTNSKEKENSPNKGQIPAQTQIAQSEDVFDPKEVKESEIIPNPLELEESWINSDYEEVAELEFIPSKEEVLEVEFTSDKKGDQKLARGWTESWTPKTVSFLNQQLMDNYLKRYKKGKPFSPVPTLLSRNYLTLPLINSNF